jgi:hypothetical protein
MLHVVLLIARVFISGSGRTFNDEGETRSCGRPAPCTILPAPSSKSMAGHAALRVLFSSVVLAATPGAATADWFYVSPAGMAHVTGIKEAVAPAPLFEAGDNAPGPWYFRGILQNVIAPADQAPAAQGPTTYLSYEEFLKLKAKGAVTRPPPDAGVLLEVVAFGPGGQPRSKPVKFSAEWLHVVPELDGARDLRLSAGNYDEAYGAPIGSRAYAERVLAAIDRDGSMGLAPRGAPSVAPKGQVVDGLFVLQSKWWRLPDAQRRAAQQDHDRRQSERFERMGRSEREWSVTADDWMTPIAIARKYSLDRGFAEGAFAVAAAALRLGTLPPGRFAPLVAGRQDGFTWTSAALLRRIATTLSSARPQQLTGYDDPRLAAIVGNVSTQIDLALSVAEPSSLKRGREEFRRRVDALGPTPTGTSHLDHDLRDPQLPASPSERAQVALELLTQPHVVCFTDPRQLEELARHVLALGREATGPDPRADDGVPIRPAALGALEHLMRPAPTADALLAKACGDSAGIVRRTVVDTAFGGRRGHNDDLNRGARLFALEALQRAGWGPAKAIAPLRELTGCCHALTYVTESKKPAPAAAADRKTHDLNLYGLREVLRVDVLILSAILDLERLPDPDLRAEAAALRAWLDAPRNRDDAGSDFLRDELNRSRTRPQR